MTDKQRISIKNRFECAIKSPSAFIENVFDIRLSAYQKLLVDYTITDKSEFIARTSHKKYRTYIYLLCNYVEMKDDDIITIVSSQKVEKLNKAELLEYLWKYWM